MGGAMVGYELAAASASAAWRRSFARARLSAGPMLFIGHAHLAADLVIRLAFEVIQPHDLGFFALQLVEQPLDLFAVAEPLLGRGGIVGDVVHLAGVGLIRARSAA